MLKKDTEIWVAVKLGRRVFELPVIERRGSLKSICELIGVSYNSAKVKQAKDGGITLWVSGNNAWEVWSEVVKK
jgi:hypothetical protein